MKTPRLLAIDPSISACGWALFCVNTTNPLDAGVFRPPKQGHLESRLALLQKTVEAFFANIEFGKEDFLVCEGPAPLHTNPMSSMVVERVRGIFETLARAKGAMVPGRINPRSIHSEILGLYGKQVNRVYVKQIARTCATHLFQEFITFKQEETNSAQLAQDLIDALLIGAAACSRVGQAQASNMSVYIYFGERKRSSFRSLRLSSKNAGTSRV